MVLLTRCLVPPHIINRLMIISYFVYLIELFLNYRLTVASIEEHWIFDTLCWDRLLLSRSSLASAAG